MVGLHASFTLSDETLDRLCLAVGSRTPGYHIHVAEGAVDEEDSLQKYGKPVVQRLHDAGLLGERSLAVHCVGINEEERALLAESHTPVDDQYHVEHEQCGRPAGGA